MQVLTLRILADHGAAPNEQGELPPSGLVKFESDTHDTHTDIATDTVDTWLYKTPGVELEGAVEVVLKLQQINRPTRVWVVKRADAIVFHTPDGDVRYNVTRQPGFYGLDGERLEDTQDLNDDVVPNEHIDVKLSYDVELEK